ncbi:helix-turn-helix transcriptional regulator [Microtetraspora sp. NBRC 13810]|uniref:helix-turn-helix transcriptional regulator n=1 Tax=Microtetraspora sp. NBRC 13810 TaxID=3030990 RepID=UPI0024A55203|nr:helix-turn-helix transcriptional regulator [Microtetraspora sp. NBRC 13810]GLW05689.1 helix-turn-helix transcriptional regulator [Microtetraspora sp. NBRC 13810]
MVFVGRDAELSALGAAYARVRGGSPATVLLGGEAGVGKTRLISEFAAPLAGEARLLRGDCPQMGENGLVFAPFTAMLRGLLRTLGADGFRRLLPRGEPGELGRLLPLLGRPAGAGDPALTRARLFEEILTLFENLAEERPLVVIVEDVHWSDRSSRELLDLLIGGQQAAAAFLLVVTYRSDQVHRAHPLRPVLAEWDRKPWTTRTELGRLGRGDVVRQLRGLSGGEPAPEVVEDVFRRSEGNPLFVEALSARVGAPLPSSLRDLLITPLDRLPAESRRVAQAAAVGGARVGHALLRAVTGLDDAGLTRALRPPVSENLLLIEEDGYAFRHALIREVLYDDVLPGERELLHVRYAETLEGAPELAPLGRAAYESALHWHAARCRPSRTLAAARRAADEAAASLAHAEQLHMLLRVLELWEQAPDPATSRADVLDEAVRAAIAAGENATAVQLIDTALSATAPTTDTPATDTPATAPPADPPAAGPPADPARTGWLIAHRGELRHLLGVPGDLDDLRAAARLTPHGHPARATVLNLFAHRLLTLPREAEGSAVARAALDAARAAGDARAEVIATVNLTYARARAGDLDAQLPHLVEAQATARRIGDRAALLHACRCEADVLQGAGRYAEAADAARRGLAATRPGLARTAGPTHAGNLAEALIALGRWDEAAEIVEHALRLAPTPSLGAYLMVLTGTIALARGDLGAAQNAAAHAREVFTGGTSYAQDHLLLVRMEVDLRKAQGRTADAARLVAEALRGGHASPRYLWPVIEAGASLAVPGLPEAAATLPVIGPVQETHRLASTAEAGQPDLWPRVADAWTDLHQPYPRALALLRAAEHAAEAGDRTRAAGHLADAAREADHLRAEPLRARIERLARLARIPLDAQGGTGPAGERAFGLTPRERDVLRLLADGRTNRQIAEELFISVKTAGVHVGNILAKLGVRGRVQAATAAHRHRLV